MKTIACAAWLVAGALILQACNGNPSTPAAPTYSNISGDYTGILQDAQAGSGSVTGTLAQHGASAGGTLTETAAAGTLSAQMSLVIDTSNNLTGSIVIDEPSAACTFSTTGTYDPVHNIINGSYTAVTNCAGDTGTYVLNQQCYDTATSVGKRTTMGLTKC